jgi:dihydrofolate synthase/folylpolyglutamate synthase
MQNYKVDGILYKNQKLNAWLATLQSNKLPNIELKLDRMFQFLELIGNPQQQLPPVIHVAGTNGKGSTIAFIHSILKAYGLQAHRYTSPHLVRFNERIVIANSQVDDAKLLEALEFLQPHFEIFPLTFFEATTALALHLFAKTRADFTLLEVGMGGRFDATNVVKNPHLTIITPISFDHQEFLGDSIAKIAFEKAGIIKPDVPVVVGAQQSAALEVINKRAVELNAPLFRINHEWNYQILANGDLHYQSNNIALTTPPPALLGEHQYHNAALAIASLDCLRLHITPQDIAAGIASAKWNGRLQKLDLTKFGLAQNIYIDGGHNEAGAEAIAAWLANLPRKPHLIMGLKADKKAEDFIKLLSPYATSICFVPITDVAFHSTESLKMLSQKMGVISTTAPNVKAALEQANSSQDILITGSLYLVGEVLRIFE